MAQGIDLAKDISPAHAQAIEAMKEQLLIVFLNRLGGKVDIPVAEIDGAGTFNLLMSADIEGTFHFITEKKH